jgi:hypothetical protein
MKVFWWQYPRGWIFADHFGFAALGEDLGGHDENIQSGYCH